MPILIFLVNYSIFSAKGLGEPVFCIGSKSYSMGGLYNFYLPRFLTLEFSMLNEFIDTDGKMQNYDFTLPYFRFVLPLPKNFAIDLNILELLNLNFDIESDWKWEESLDDSLRRIVKSRGTASLIKFCIGGDILSRISYKVGPFFVFGNSLEEWVIDFGAKKDTYYTLILNFSGRGWTFSSNINLWRINLSTCFLSSSSLVLDKKLPKKLICAITFSITKNFIIGTGIDYWEWEKPMRKYSLGCELYYKNIFYRSGFYRSNWYYEKIKENVFSLGLGFPFKSLCTIDLSFEFGNRSDGNILEKIYRVGITLQGQEEI